MKFLLFVSALALASAAEFHQQIIGGEISERGQWPWMVSLRGRAQEGHGCGGTLLSERWVLSAAHCFMNNPSPEDLLVEIGMYQQSANDAVQILGVETMVFHPLFWEMEPGGPYDLILMRLNEDADLTSEYIATATLASPDIDYTVNPDCYIIGWGRNDRSSGIYSDFLIQARAPVLDYPTCVDRYTTLPYEIFEDHICLGDPAEAEDVSACHGDSGSPAQCLVNGEWHVVGATSWVGTLECDDYPSVYIRLSSFRDWIDSVINA